MNTIWEKIKRWMMSLTLQEQKKREYAEFAQEVAALQELSDLELDADYVCAKTQYEHKKRTLAFSSVIGVLVMVGLWGTGADFIGQLLLLLTGGQGDEAELAKISMMVSAITIASITFLIMFTLLSDISDLRRLHRRLLVIETVQKNDLEGKK